MSALSDALAAMGKATPGPWTAYIGEEIHRILDAAGKLLAELWMRKSYDNKANAKLIAAAPDMAAWIKKALSLFTDAKWAIDAAYGEGSKLGEVIEALIAEAKPKEVGRC